MFIPFRFRLRGKGIDAAWIDSARKRITIVSRRLLREWGDSLLKDIKADQSLFKYDVKPVNDKFTSVRRRKGALKASLWRGRVHKTQGRTLGVEFGWRVPYGPVLEWGSDKASWPIAPKGSRVAEDGTVSPIKALRFRYGGKIVYAKHVTHKWDKGQMRPHFGPAADRLSDTLEKDLGKAMKEALDHGR